MQPKWFKEEICEELEGACTYMKCAIDTMKTHPEWAKQFYEMADQEQDHATHLYKMFMSMYTDEAEPSNTMKDYMEAVMTCFSEYMRKFEDHKITYDMMAKQEAKKTTPVSSYVPSSTIV